MRESRSGRPRARIRMQSLLLMDVPVRELAQCMGRASNKRERETERKGAQYDRINARPMGGGIVVVVLQRHKYKTN